MGMIGDTATGRARGRGRETLGCDAAYDADLVGVDADDIFPVGLLRLVLGVGGGEHLLFLSRLREQPVDLGGPARLARLGELAGHLKM